MIVAGTNLQPSKGKQRRRLLWCSSCVVVVRFGFTKRHFPQVDLQVCCMGETAEEGGGVTLDGAHLVQFHVASEYERASIWKRIFPLIRQSLYQGESALSLHCGQASCSGSGHGDYSYYGGRGSDPPQASYPVAVSLQGLEAVGLGAQDCPFRDIGGSVAQGSGTGSI